MTRCTKPPVAGGLPATRLPLVENLPRIVGTLLLILCLFFKPALLHAAEELLDAGRATTIDYILERAVSQGLIGGGVVLVGNHEGVIYTTSRGKVGFSADSPTLTERTMFDIASLTKVVATAPAIMKLLEEGRITLLDPLTRWFPEFEGTGQEEITILNLLTHTSGLNDITFNSVDPLKTAIHKMGVQRSGRLPGSNFRYADINFILLAELIQRASGVPLDRYCRENFYGPLGMGDTMFLPPHERSGSIAPTIGTANQLLTGVVQDENARLLGGVAGHAGLFSSASDLSRFAAMILNNGKLHGVPVFNERVLSQMTAPYFYSNGKVVRGLGWDIYSPYSSPRGSFFSAMSFGHTGYSGSSIWIDPQRDLFVILLTVRYNYRDPRQINRLRSDISTIAASVFSHYREPTEVLENM
ncbi:MAG: serine hydrolase [Verrucomicrobia bacterium]|nr:serine hydrolase [Deltaproteobacteria bacterium]